MVDFVVGSSARLGIRGRILRWSYRKIGRLSSSTRRLRTSKLVASHFSDFARACLATADLSFGSSSNLCVENRNAFKHRFKELRTQDNDARLEQVCSVEPSKRGVERAFYLGCVGLTDEPRAGNA